MQYLTFSALCVILSQIIFITADKCITRGILMILNFSDKIQYLREKCSMTQTDLAKRLGISRSAVNAWEMSISTPSLANVMEMISIFGVSADYMLSLSDRVTVDVTELDNEKREIVFKLVECLKK